MGPQRTLYVPGPVLREGRNEVLLLELEGAGAAEVHLSGRPGAPPDPAHAGTGPGADTEAGAHVGTDDGADVGAHVGTDARTHVGTEVGADAAADTGGGNDGRPDGDGSRSGGDGGRDTATA
nr:hypothetical protein [Streptomyces pactum]